MEIGLVLDSKDPEALAPFWAAALGYVVVGSVENYVMLLPDGQEGPKLLLQLVSEHKTDKNRMHIDIEVANIEKLAADLVALGGTRLTADVHSEHGHEWIVMSDPEGNEFCVCDAGAC
jgi:predicted enzyme related to lactoylglutathione lyase